MAYPTSYNAFRRAPGENAEAIVPSVENMPSLRPSDVLIKIHAVSLNYRDVGMLHGKYPVPVKDQGIPASDCAGEVVALGSAVQGVSIGDRVSPIFDLKYIKDVDPQNEYAQLGGTVDGVLQEYAVFDENVLVHVPQHLSWEEAACITCAGTTAWNSLDMPKNQGRQTTALMLGKIETVGAIAMAGRLTIIGTGGVSMFALLICLGAGIQPIITSSSDEKLRDIAALGREGAIKVINYRTNPDWEKEVLRLTGGRGVDIVLETVGGTSIKRSIESLATRGMIAWIGFLGGLALDGFAEALGQLFLKVGTLRPIQVGSKVDQANLCRFLEETKSSLKPIIGKTFTFDESPAAFDCLYTGGVMGKVVITMG